jgi:adenylosuccinate lyase
LDKLLINNEAIQNDLQKNWAVVTEAIQTILRREGYPEPYEALKALTRVHSHIDQRTILEFIESLDIEQAVKDELKKISPENYMGVYDF